MKKLLLLPLIWLTFSCYNKIPDGEFRLINWNGQKEYLPQQYYTFKGNEFGAFVIDEHGDKVAYGTKTIAYESNDVFTFTRNDTVYRWKYSLNKDTLTMKSQTIDMHIICLKTN